MNQLYEQWFWYRLGATDLQAPINTLGTATITQLSSAQATVSYAGSNGLTIGVTYLLTGGGAGSGSSDLGESISIQNTSGSAESVHFFQYSNFTLNDSGTNATNYVQFQNSNAVDQWAMSGNETLAETVITPKPNFREENDEFRSR